MHSLVLGLLSSWGLLVSQAVEVFSFNEAGVPCIRIPSIVRLGGAKGQTLLAVAECGIFGRVGDDCVPSGYVPPKPEPLTPIVPLCSKTSNDGGQTWSTLRNVTTEFVHSQNPTMVWDEVQNIAVMYFNRYFYPTGSSAHGHELQLWHMKTADGLTWSMPLRIDSMLASLSPPRNGTVPGPGTAVQLRTGKHRGRILLPIYLPNCNNGTSQDCAAAVYTDDGGNTWQSSAVPASGQGGHRGWYPYMSESVVAEDLQGNVFLNMRNGRNVPCACRGVAVSRDGGATFGPLTFDSALLDPQDIEGCQASLISFNAGASFAFSNPHSSSSRQDMTVLVSDARSRATNLTWTVKDSVAPGQGAAYSCLVDNTIHGLGLLYEAAKAGCAGHACTILYKALPSTSNVLWMGSKSTWV